MTYAPLKKPRSQPSHPGPRKPASPSYRTPARSFPDMRGTAPSGAQPLSGTPWPIAAGTFLPLGSVPPQATGPSMEPGPTAHSLLVQAKLAVGAANDPLEREADRISEHVVSYLNGDRGQPPPRSPQRGSLMSGSEGVLQRECSACVQEDDEPTTIQRQVATGIPAVSSSGVPAPAGFAEEVQHSQTHGGRPLAPALRGGMERGFGSDFSRVRVHNDTRAADLARRVRARAFTVGDDVFFNRGEFRPNDRSGQTLIAHELAHVVQQSRLSDATIRRSLAEDQTSASRLGTATPTTRAYSGPEDPLPLPHPIFTDCTAVDGDALTKALDKARKLTSKALEQMDRPDLPVLNTIFGPSSFHGDAGAKRRDRLKVIIELVLAALKFVKKQSEGPRRRGPRLKTGAAAIKPVEEQAIEPPTFKCTGPGNGKVAEYFREKRDYLESTRSEPARIDLYEEFYAQGQSTLEQAGVLIHEMVHHATGDSGDIYTDLVSARTLAHITGLPLHLNPDTITTFIIASSEGVDTALQTHSRDFAFTVSKTIPQDLHPKIQVIGDLSMWVLFVSRDFITRPKGSKPAMDIYLGPKWEGGGLEEKLTNELSPSDQLRKEDVDMMIWGLVDDWIKRIHPGFSGTRRSENVVTWRSQVRLDHREGFAGGLSPGLLDVIGQVDLPIPWAEFKRNHESPAATAVTKFLETQARIPSEIICLMLRLFEQVPHKYFDEEWPQ